MSKTSVTQQPIELTLLCIAGEAQCVNTQVLKGLCSSDKSESPSGSRLEWPGCEQCVEISAQSATCASSWTTPLGARGSRRAQMECAHLHAQLFETSSLWKRSRARSAGLSKPARRKGGPAIACKLQPDGSVPRKLRACASLQAGFPHQIHTPLQ